MQHLALRTGIRIGIVLSFALLSNAFFERSTGPIFTILLLSWLFVYIALLSAIRRKERSVFHTLSAATLMAPLFLILLTRKNPFVLSISVFAILAIMTVFTTVSLVSTKPITGLGKLLFSPFVLSYEYGISAWQAGRQLFSGDVIPSFPDQTRWLGKTVPVIRGLILSLPIVILIYGLLSAGDPIFASVTGHYLDFRFLFSLPERGVFTVMIFLLLLPLVYIKSTVGSFPRFNPLHRLNYRRELVVAILPVLSIIAVFLIIQWPYVFATVPYETDLSRFGVATYSEYVRRGFFEFIVLATILYGLLWVIRLSLVTDTSRSRRLLLIISLIMTGELAIFIIGLTRRIFLYQAYHGWSLIRVYGLWLLVVLSGLVITLQLRHFLRFGWYRIEIAFVYCMVVALGLFNSERYIVETHPPTVNSRVDTIYLSRLSADGVDGWILAFDHVKQVLGEWQPENVPMMTADDRKTVAYSSYILRQIFEEYHRLTRRYGTESDRHTYLATLYASLRNAYSQPPQSQSDTNESSEIQRLNVDWDTLQSSGHATKYFQSITMSWDMPYPGDGQRFYLNVTRPQISRLYRYVRSDQTLSDELFIDSVYQWSYAEYRAYRKLKDSISLTELLHLEQKFFSLYDAILLLPLENRQYQSDVSFAMPFVD